MLGSSTWHFYTKAWDFTSAGFFARGLCWLVALSVSFMGDKCFISYAACSLIIDLRSEHEYWSSSMKVYFCTAKYSGAWFFMSHITFVWDADLLVICCFHNWDENQDVYKMLWILYCRAYAYSKSMKDWWPLGCIWCYLNP